MTKTAIIIPARYGSSRLEGKPLLKVAGKPIIQWVYEKAQQAKLADMIIVATDDKRIYDAVKAFGGEVEMTSVNHKCGSDRIREVVERHNEISFIVNFITWLYYTSTFSKCQYWFCSGNDFRNGSAGLNCY